MSAVHGERRVGAITWNPRFEADDPSACSETISSAPTRSPNCPRVSTHGPHLPSLFEVRVIRTVAPSASRRCSTARASRKVTVASATPLSVAVPVVLHGFSKPPAGTSALVSPGKFWLPSWWPGSIAMVSDRSGRAFGVRVGAGVLFAVFGRALGRGALHGLGLLASLLVGVGSGV